ncbi:hypothetical protein CLU92_0960 [Janthinobacterium sp. 61]|nr:hypothetical protein [Janthinobacterium sp. 61]PKV43645.1 hypothetical protein CLU92_0960 [Janthinobacterium sp. 61]
MMKNITNDKWPGKRASPIATTIMDTVYANGAVQPRLFSEAEL